MRLPPFDFATFGTLLCYMRRESTRLLLARLAYGRDIQIDRREVRFY